MGSGTFSDMTRNETSRARFIRSAVRLLRKYKFDGLGKLEGGWNRSSFCFLVKKFFENF